MSVGFASCPRFGVDPYTFCYVTVRHRYLIPPSRHPWPLHVRYLHVELGLPDLSLGILHLHRLFLVFVFFVPFAGVS